MKKSLRFLGMGLSQTSRFPTKECRNSTYPTYWKISKNKNNIFTFKKIATKTKYIERNSVSVSSFFFEVEAHFGNDSNILEIKCVKKNEWTLIVFFLSWTEFLKIYLISSWSLLNGILRKGRKKETIRLVWEIHLFLSTVETRCSDGIKKILNFLCSDYLKKLKQVSGFVSNQGKKEVRNVMVYKIS